ncbi:MAG TPA: hypothetical protein VFP72_08735 [Kineosporiaceae bacterium]|nr:hypothetical protein [Kineosporiaceae bacterium]
MPDLVPTPLPPVRRRLTEIEYVNWCFGQPYNIAVVVHLLGPVTVAGVRAAVAGLQRRHPLLGVTTVVDQDGTPWLDSAGVGPVPVRVIGHAGPHAAARLLDEEVATPFVMDRVAAAPDEHPGARPPLLRVVVLVPRQPGGGLDVVLGAQHVIVDGLSMFFLVRDLLGLVRTPDPTPAVVDAAARCERVLPPEAGRIYRTPAAALTVRALLRTYLALRSVMRRRPIPGRGPGAGSPGQGSPGQGSPVPRPGGGQLSGAGQTPVHSWQLPPDRTAALLRRCRAEGVSVQSALCTAFLPSYGAVNTPVNLRGRLAVDASESVGLYVGNAVVMRSYRDRRDFWWNARTFHRRLRRAMRDPFLMIRFCPSTVPRPVVHDVMTGMMALVGHRRPLAVTNLGVLDGAGLTLGTGDGPRVESFHAGMSGFASASVLTVYTIDGVMHFHLRGRPDMTDEQTAQEAERATALLLAALRTPDSRAHGR